VLAGHFLLLYKYDQTVQGRAFIYQLPAFVIKLKKCPKLWTVSWWLMNDDFPEKLLVFGNDRSSDFINTIIQELVRANRHKIKYQTLATMEEPSKARLSVHRPEFYSSRYPSENIRHLQTHFPLQDSQANLPLRSLLHAPSDEYRLTTADFLLEVTPSCKDSDRKRKMATRGRP
jgi:hypothetical protein